MISVLLYFTSLKPGVHLGEIYLANRPFAIVRAGSKTTDSYPKMSQRIPVWVGDRLIISSNGAVKGVYDGHVFVLRGPTEWLAPKKGEFDQNNPRANQRILARTDMGSKGEKELTQFVPLATGSHPNPDFYVDSSGRIGLAWLAPASVRSVALTISVAGDKLGPYRYPAHVALSPDSRVGWMEDVDLGTKLRRDYEQESEETPITFTFHPDARREISVSGLLTSREESRELDPICRDLSESLSPSNLKTDTGWFERLNDFLLATQDSMPAANAYWTVAAWVKLPGESATQAAMEDVFSSLHLSFRPVDRASKHGPARPSSRR